MRLQSDKSKRATCFCREFHQALPQLLKPDGLYSFFNGYVLWFQCVQLSGTLATPCLQPKPRSISVSTRHQVPSRTPRCAAQARG
jgi:spermidine synthase